MYRRSHFIVPATWGRAREAMGRTYISFDPFSRSKVVGRPKTTSPMARNMKIYARDGTALMKMIYIVPSLSNSLSFFRAIAIPKGTPSRYAAKVAMMPMTKEKPSLEKDCFTVPTLV